MSKSEKYSMLISLVARGESLCARACANEWGIKSEVVDWIEAQFK